MASPTEKAKGEVVRGKKIAALVGNRLREDTESSLLIDEVIASLTRALSVLDSDEARSSEVSSSGKRKVNRLLGERKEVLYRKRKQPSPTKQVTSKTIIDGYTWRKYGKKSIRGATHPRGYYNCSHKDQGCRATRQVQISEEDASLYVITYYSEHTCKQISPQFHSHSSLKEQSLITFGSNAYNFPTQDAPLLSSSFPLGDCKSTTACSSYSGNSLIPYQGISEGLQTMDSVSDVGDHVGMDMGFANMDSFDYDEMFSFDDEGRFSHHKDGMNGGAPFF